MYDYAAGATLIGSLSDSCSCAGGATGCSCNISFGGILTFLTTAPNITSVSFTCSSSAQNGGGEIYAYIYSNGSQTYIWNQVDPNGLTTVEGDWDNVTAIEFQCSGGCGGGPGSDNNISMSVTQSSVEALGEEVSSGYSQGIII